MGEGDFDSRHPTPKLPIFSLPRPKLPEPPGLLTPPLHPGAAVPFQWEEAPGRPRPCPPRSPPRSPVVMVGAKRCLDLPPRLFHDKQSTTTTAANHITIPSPTTVLEGPYPCPRKRLASTWSFRQVGSRERIAFGSMRWGRGHQGGSNTSLSEFFCCDRDQDALGDHTKVKITRVRRRRSFLSLSPKNSHLWASICEGLKQVVSWKRRPTPPTEAKSKSKSKTLGQLSC